MISLRRGDSPIRNVQFGRDLQLVDLRASGEVDPLRFQATLIVMGVATFSFAFASFYYYGASLGGRIDARDDPQPEFGLPFTHAALTNDPGRHAARRPDAAEFSKRNSARAGDVLKMGRWRARLCAGRISVSDGAEAVPPVRVF